MKIVFAGDLFLGGDLLNYDFKDCIQYNGYHDADLRIVNLEHPISRSTETADKSALFADDSVLENLKSGRVDAVCLANNHIHDKKDAGIIDTINYLEKADIKFFGAGRNLQEARKPLWVNESTCVLGYCQFDAPTLKNIQIATTHRPGVCPLTYEQIMSDLDLLPKGTHAILYFHWGREHVWMTQYDNLELADKLLGKQKVSLILGTHPHRVQGFLSKDVKRAYFSLGNFVFPNFYIKPPTEVLNTLDKYLSKEKMDMTRQYHSVSKITYKKWRFVNRVSLVVEFETVMSKVKHNFIYQEDDRPVVRPLAGWRLAFFKVRVQYLNNIYKIPGIIYKLLEKCTSKLRLKIWRVQIAGFKIRQNGFRWGISKILSKF